MAIVLGLAAAAVAYLLLASHSQNQVYQSRPPMSAFTPRPSAPNGTQYLNDVIAGDSTPILAGEGDSGSGPSAQQDVGLAGAGFGAATAATGGASSALAFAGAATIPIVGAAVAGVGLVMGAIIRHHQEAVKREKQSILQGVERFYDVIGNMVKLYNSHQIGPQEGIAAVHSALDIYYQAVAHTMKPTTPPNHWGTLPATNGPNGVPRFRDNAAWVGHAIPIRSVKGANGPYYNAFLWLEPFAGRIVQYFTYAAGSAHIITNAAMPPSTAFPGIGAFKIIFNPGTRTS